MTTTEKNMIDAYYVLLENLSISAKTELIDRLKKSIKSKSKASKNGLEKSFGGWETEKSPEEIINEINDDLKFGFKTINLQ